ncbi:MAG: hypothetical protein ABJM58_07360 [Alteripontixanthobacter sp.]
MTLKSLFLAAAAGALAVTPLAAQSTFVDRAPTPATNTSNLGGDSEVAPAIIIALLAAAGMAALLIVEDDDNENALSR